jgi:cystathionine beta-lyase
MMSFDFDKLVNREGTLSYKWDVGEDVLPMWVADMDFETAPAVKDAVVKRAEHGIYAYSYAPDEYFGTIADFFEKRHGYRFDTADMIYSSGIVAAISSIVRKLTTAGEKVLIQPPVFNLFYNSVINNGRFIVENDLVLKDGKYEIDFDDLEKKLSDPQVTLFILCNPHNPVGKVFGADELARMGELCKKYNVTVLSDEIHCDFTYPKNSYVPFASVNDTCKNISVTCVSPSKSFNLAGLYASCVIAHDPLLRHRVWRGINTDEVGEPNTFAVQACIAAYREGGEWLDALVDYIEENKRYASNYIKENIPEIFVPESRATYLLWADVSAVGISSDELCERLEREAGLKLSDGLEYGECGRYFVRINLATQRARVEEGLKRLKKGIDIILNAAF